MSSLRIDGDKSAKVWAKRFQKLIDAAIEDGAEVHVHDETLSLAIKKDGTAITTFEGRDVSDEF